MKQTILTHMTKDVRNFFDMTTKPRPAQNRIFCSRVTQTNLTKLVSFVSCCIMMAYLA